MTKAVPRNILPHVALRNAVFFNPGGAAGACLVDEPGEIVEIPERDMEKEVSRGFYLCRREGRNIPVSYTHLDVYKRQKDGF